MTGLSSQGKIIIMEPTGWEFRMVTVGRIREVVSLMELSYMKMTKTCTGRCKNDITIYRVISYLSQVNLHCFGLKFYTLKEVKGSLREIFVSCFLFKFKTGESCEQNFSG